MDSRSERPNEGTRRISGHQAPVSASGDDTADDEDAQMLGMVRTAPRVLRTVVEEAALGTPGVARMATRATTGGEWSRLLGRATPHQGVRLTVHGNVVDVDVYLVAEPTANMLEVGSAVQEAVSAAVEHILGMRAQQINVYIEDVA